MIKDFWRSTYPSTAIPIELGHGKDFRIRQYEGAPWMIHLQCRRDAAKLLEQGYHVMSQMVLTRNQGDERNRVIVTYCLAPSIHYDRGD